MDWSIGFPKVKDPVNNHEFMQAANKFIAEFSVNVKTVKESKFNSLFLFKQNILHFGDPKYLDQLEKDKQNYYQNKAIVSF
jgi:hypothetical protein